MGSLCTILLWDSLIAPCVGCVLVRIPLYDSFVGLFVGCVLVRISSHVTRDTHVWLVARGWLDCLVFSMGFILACASTLRTFLHNNNISISQTSGNVKANVYGIDQLTGRILWWCRRHRL